MRATASQYTGASSTSTVRPKSPRSTSNGLINTQAVAQPTKRTHLADFLPLPRHSLFHVKLTIHQLWNVPYVSGRFSVRWKFQNVQSMRGNGLKAKMRASAAAASVSNLTATHKGKGRVVSGESVESNATGSDSLLVMEDSSRSTLLSNDGSSSSAPSPLFKNAFLPTENGDMLEFSHESRGRTDYVDLREHNVKWGQTINVLVQMDVQRDTKELQPSQLKLVVEQLRIPGDPDAPQNPRLGAVYLNLAEYADEGPVMRQHLLRQSKTNATLQVTVELTHVDGEKDYKSPPLRKGEVMAGVATLLENSPYGSLPRPSFSRRPSAGPAFVLSGDNIQLEPSPGGSRPNSPRSRALNPNPESFRTTDNIIEAIFNPVATSSTTPSPFTYYVPPKPRQPPALDLSTIDDRLEEESERIPSAVSGDSSGVSRSFSMSTHSEQSHASVAPSIGAEKPTRQRWWHKFGQQRQEQPQPRRSASSRTSYSNQSKNGYSRPNSPPPASQSPSIMASSLPASSRQSKSSGEDHDIHTPASDEVDPEVDIGSDVPTRPKETRLVSGNEQVGAPQVFLRRPTTVGGRRPGATSVQSRGS